MNTPPAPPPEGVLIESARREARLSVREAARRAGISEGWWRQVVKGYQSLSGGTAGLVRDVPAETVAKMAAVAGVTPEQMASEGQRPDAAEAMRHAPAARPVLAPAPAAASADSAPPPQDIIEFALESGVNPADPDDPHLRPVREEIAAATVRHGVAAPGRLVFQGQPWSADEAKTWDNPLIGWRSKELLIAITRARRDHDEAGWRNRSGRAGLTLATLARR